MKIKYLVLVSLLLAIITVGAVSASDNVADDGLAVDEEMDDSIEQVDESIVENDESIDEEPQLATGDDDAIGYEEEDFYFYISEQTDPYSSVVGVQKNNYSLQGSYKIFVNDTLKKEIVADDGYKSYRMSDLGVTSPGMYKIDLYFNDALLKSATCHYAAYSMNVYVSTEGYNPEGVLNIQVNGPSDYKGNVTVEINGQSYNVQLRENGIGITTVSTKGMNLGRYSAIVRFSGDENYPPEYFKNAFDYGPKLTCPITIATGDDEYLTLTAPSGTEGIARFTLYNEDNGYCALDKNVTFSNGIASCSLSDLPVGLYWVDAVSSIGNDTLYTDAEIYILKNDPKISVSIAKSEITVGDNLIINLNGPANTVFSIVVDEHRIKDVIMPDVKLSELVSGLPLGNHKIRIIGSSYVKAFDVTVKEKAPVKKDTIKLTLTKVKVKKSAKKLILKATLKINGKAKKGLKVKFKFGKKSYSAKTNSKGIAKVTVKKAVLKKLKVGKKVTYKASYGKTVKKVTVKVRR